MEENITDELRTALNYLRAGRIKDARPIILQILKTNPEIDQAWYMLSFVVSDRDKQIYALQQVITLNPDHEKAKARLAKVLAGGSDSPTASSSAQPAKAGREEAVSLGGRVDQESPDDARLGLMDSKEEAAKTVGEKPEKKTKKQKKKKKEKKPKKPKKQKKPKKSKEPKEDLTSQEEKPDDGMITSGTFGEYQGQKRNWGRLVFITIALLVIVGGCYFLFTIGGDVVSGIINPDNPQAGDVVEETVVPDVTETPTTPSGGRQLPPTWTPSPLPSETPTIEPSKTPTPTIEVNI